MPKPTAWFHSLTESVFALGAAAREYRSANQAAQVAAWNAEPVRLLPVDGELSVPGAHHFRPHDEAVSRIADLYSGLQWQTRDRYENTALAYAYGTAAALLAVHRGETPRHVELRRHDGWYELPGGPLPDLRNQLSEWSGCEQLARLRNALLDCERVADAANDLLFRDYLADHEAAEMTHASEFAAGLADRAYAYGEQAESGLHFLLIAARNNLTSKDDQ